MLKPGKNTVMPVGINAVTSFVVEEEERPRSSSVLLNPRVVLKDCSACEQQFPEGGFSKKQWQCKKMRRCSNCIKEVLLSTGEGGSKGQGGHKRVYSQMEHVLKNLNSILNKMK
jgi:hypothetical protein